MIINFRFIAESIPKLLGAIPITLLMAFASAVIGWLLGLGIALIIRFRCFHRYLRCMSRFCEVCR